jgi:hypothetical protein
LISKQNYLILLNELIPLNKLTSNKNDQKKIIDGAVLYHATRLLGNEVLKSLSSELGSADKHEGIVIRDSNISNEPFKITGEFLVQGLESKFNKK